ncbi:MAG: hypothetical protein IKN43_05350 [Selenomonadaceae bacterium]|nr:hypothetical protein [Selenomonadaceae bacterium]
MFHSWSTFPPLRGPPPLLDVEAEEKLSWLYRIMGRNVSTWHLEAEIFAVYTEGKNNVVTVKSLLEMMSVADEEKDFDRLEKLIITFDDIGMKYRANEVVYYRNVLK